MNLINELRELAEDLYVNAQNVQSSVPPESSHDSIC